ncbi:DUF1064 domain-containing protein [Microcoleus sp. herbarium14]|uniref:DUF1064 domain-containing protein n=1 Tax=Microcoleus sp. herbarium14 TaxID=3055439 RepID=UPI002FCF835F
MTSVCSTISFKILHFNCNEILQKSGFASQESISHSCEAKPDFWEVVAINSKYRNSIIYFDLKTNTVLAQRPSTGALTKHIVKFDSKWEFSVYQCLLRICGVDDIELQPVIKLKSEFGNFGTLTYRCDFLVYNFFYIEAKGVVTPEALVKFKTLEILYPDIAARLLIVTSASKHLFGKKLPATLDISALQTVLVNFQKYKTNRHE